ncbi:MAG: hypothetical protein ACK4U0_17265 [Mesorhizobium sp.]
MTISEALEWAWRDELPKVPTSAGGAGGPRAGNAWNSILAFGEIGTVIDRQPNRWGCIPFDMAGWPHADALAIADAVERLADCAIVAPDGWNPMPELALLDAGMAARAAHDALLRATEDDGAGQRRFRTSPGLIVTRHAILGTAPDWRMDDPPVLRFEAHDNGRAKWFVQRETRQVIGSNHDGTDRVEVVTIEVDGWSTKHRRPVTGSYRKPYLDPDPVPVMVARAEYEILVAALDMLHEALRGRLSSIDLAPCGWPVRPWEGDSVDGRARRGKILPDLKALRAALSGR